MEIGWEVGVEMARDCGVERRGEGACRAVRQARMMRGSQRQAARKLSSGSGVDGR